MNWEYIKPKVSKKVFLYLATFAQKNGGVDRSDLRRVLEKHNIKIRYSFGEPHFEEALIKWSEVYK
tara:strand:+ start:316 stop:513 length:198 start_codon:yes stop_codon:yes gene_type:complete